MLGFDEPSYREVVTGAGALRGRIEEIAQEVTDKGYSRIYFIGSGGSYAVMFPYDDLFKQHSTVPSVCSIAAELVLTGNATLGGDAIAIFSSLSGTTQETLAALEYCNERGVTTIALTGNGDSPIGQSASYALVNPANDENCSESIDIQLLLLTTALLHKRGEYDQYPQLADTLDDIADCLTTTHEEAEERSAAFAARFKDADYHFCVGAGNLWGFTYNYSMCILEEMQWLHTTRVHGAEFFHGSLELIDRDTSVLLIKGEDVSRPLMDRVQSFCEKYNDATTVIDTVDYTLPGVPQEFRGIIAPIVIDAVTMRYTKHLEAARDHSLAIRRYYKKVEY